MVGRNEVWQAAARIRARPAGQDGKRERVSVRSVRKELGRGSFGDIAPPLDEWKKNEKYQPVIESCDLTDAFAIRLAAIGRDLLEHARVEVTRERLAEFAAREEGIAGERSTLDEALDRIEELEDEVSALRLELDRSRSNGERPTEVRPVVPEPVMAPPEPGAPDLAGFVETLMGRKRARDADAFWQGVRDAVEASMLQKGPMPVHGLFRALPERLKAKGAEVGLPLTPAWLRYHLLRLAEEGQGLVEIDGKFGIAPVGAAQDEPMVSEDAVEDEPLGKRPFWRRFMLSVHEVLVERGPSTVEEILEGMPAELIRETRRFQKITPGRLRYKLMERIGQGRPFEKMKDGRFAAVEGLLPWNGAVPVSRMGRAGQPLDRKGRI